jgi:hypothetical protein
LSGFGFRAVTILSIIIPIVEERGAKRPTHEYKCRQNADGNCEFKTGEELLHRAGRQSLR